MELQELGDRPPHIHTFDDPIHKAVLQHEFRRLEVVGEPLFDGAFDDPASGEADEDLWLGEDDVA